MPGKTIYVVRLNFTIPEKEAEFNQWYNQKHLPDFRSLPGVMEGTRYEILRGRKLNPKYLTMYELEGEDVVEGVLNSPEAVEVGEDMTRQWGEGAVSDLTIGAYRRIGP
ncbi:MAG: hypothetical protein V3U31_00840 [Dehalococcoidia bacterium]